MISEPQPLASHHITSTFDCSYSQLNEWLTKKALANQQSRASRTFVCVNENNEVLGYYALAAGAVSHSEATGALRRNMPDPIPVVVLGRLAVDNSMKGKQLGSSLLQDAVKKSMVIAQNAGVKAILVHAIDQSAANFYLKHGFVASPISPLTLFLKIQ